METFQVEDQLGQEKLCKKIDVENTHLQEKKYEKTAFLTAFSESSSSVSDSLHHIMEPSLRHSKQKFSSTSKPMSASVSLCKHLTKTKKGDKDHGFGKDVKEEKRKERETEENQGRRKMFSGKRKGVESSKDRLCANLPTKQGNYEHKQVSSTLPLYTGHDWYVVC